LFLIEFVAAWSWYGHFSKSKCRNQDLLLGATRWKKFWYGIFSQ